MSGSLIDLGSNDDISNGGAFNDTILGGSGNDLIAGYGGNDSLLGGNDRDSINGGNGDDTILGESGNDLLLAGAGNDRLFGGDGNDTLRAEAPTVDDASLIGTLPPSYFDGGDGDDLFRVYNGSDTIIGGIGTDQVEFLSDYQIIALGDVSNDQASGIDHIILSGADQTLLLSAADVSRLTDSNVLRVSGASGNDYDLTGGGWVRGASADGFTTFTNGAATVLIADNLVGGGGVPDASLVGTDGNDSTSLGVGSDSYLGLGGSDSILGNDGNDTIGGDDGADTIFGGGGNDSILGGNGNDRIFAEAGSDTVDAGAGNSDRILYNQNGGEAINAVITSSGGSSGVNTAIVTTATQGTDNLRGFELLSASSGNDSITVTTAATAIENLFVFGSAGDDTLVDNYRQNGVFADFLSSSVTSGVFVNLGVGVATDGLGGNDSLVGFTAVNATSFNDTLIGSNANDRFRPWQGNDSIDGGSGSGDILDYSQNSSSQVVSVNLSLGLANDGLGGTDTLVGIEQVRGGGGNDTIIGDGSDNNFRGNSGNDLLDGGAGAADVVDYSFASTGVSVNLGAGRASDGQLGTDTLANIEHVWGSGSADTLIGGNSNEVLRGNAGSDSISGGGGNADIADYRNATTGISVNLANGVVQDGQGGNDTVSLVEQIWGSSFADSMLGGAGNDLFVGSSGADTFDGGGGIDAVNYSFNPSNNTAATRGVSIDLTAGTGRDGYDSAEVLSGIEIIYGTSFADTITGGNFEETLYGNGGADILRGGGSNDQIFAAASGTLAGDGGNDVLNGSTANDLLDGGADHDTLYGNGGADSFAGGDGADQLVAGNGADTMDGGQGDDSIYGLGGADSLFGGEGDDDIFANGFPVAVRFEGGAGNDEMHGSDGADSMAGGADADTLYGNGGANFLDGGAGNDLLIGNGLGETLFGGAGDDVVLIGNVTVADILALFNS